MLDKRDWMATEIGLVGKQKEDGDERDRRGKEEGHRKTTFWRCDMKQGLLIYSSKILVSIFATAPYAKMT